MKRHRRTTALFKVLVPGVLFSAVLSLKSARPVCAATQVFLGFMDDEVNEVLQNVLKNQTGATVVAISGDDLKGQLFARPLNSYGANPLRTAYREFNSGNLKKTRASRTPGLLTPGNRLSQALAPLKSDPMKLRQLEQLVDPGAVIRTSRNGRMDPSLSIVEFPAAHATGDLIVIVKSPEMGRQPSLLRSYLESVLRAVRTLPEAAPARGGARLNVFGTSGGVSPLLKPGQVTPVTSSIFVGMEVEPEVASSGRYHGVVSFIGPDSGPVRYFDQSFKTRNEAENAARAFFLSPALEGGLPVDRKGPTFGKALARARGRNSPISLTTSFFSGQELKHRAEGFGGVAVAMEDAQVLAAARAVGVEARVQRLITDPPVIPDRLRLAINQWIRRKRSNSRDYEEAILWGLRGNPLGDLKTRPELREAARWSAFDSPAMEEFQDLVASVTVDGKRFVIDPLFAETATNFLKDAAKGDLLVTQLNGERGYGGIITRTIYEGLDSSARAELDLLLDGKSKRIAEAARGIIEREAGKSSESELRILIRRMLADCGWLDLPPTSPLREKIERLLRSGLATTTDEEEKARLLAKLRLLQEKGKVRLLASSDQASEKGAFQLDRWVVQTRWDGNLGRKVNYLGNEGMSHSSVDRLFYRTGLVLKTPEAAHRFVMEQLADSVKRRLQFCAAGFRRVSNRGP